MRFHDFFAIIGHRIDSGLAEMVNRVSYDNSNVTFLSPDHCSCHQDHPKLHYLLVEILEFHEKMGT